MTSVAELDARVMRAAALLDSAPEQAALEAQAVLELHPEHPAATLLLGAARRGSGQLGEAASTFGSLAARQPDSAVAHLELARTLRAQGRPQEARRALLRALELEPDLARAWRELSSVQAELGELAECDRSYARYARLVDEDAPLAEAAAALAQGRLGFADALLGRRLAQSPGDVAALRLQAEVAAAAEEFPRAEQLLGESLRLAPGYARARFELARVLFEQQKAAAVLPLLERLIALEPDSLRYRALQASAYGMLGHSEQAVEILAALVQASPQAEWLWVNYGHVLRGAGRTAEAIAAYRGGIAARASFGEAWFSLANLKTFRFSAEDLALIRGELARGELAAADRVHLEFTLGKALEDQRDFAQAFTHYAAANALQRRSLQYDADSMSALLRRIQRLFTAEFLAARTDWGDPTPDPIFVLGMPRAGSTLLEQILASHSQVEATRELFEVRGIALELGLREGPAQVSHYPESVARLTRHQVAALGARYLELTRANRQTGRPRFVDKMPFNFAHTALIHLMLPNARIIDARRAPMACCFANFKQHYQRGASFSYEQTELGRYYRDYAALMAHFDRVLPGRVLRVDYERLVADLEGEVRRILEYCDLPFEAQCLRFHETQRAVLTPSSEQVRRPVYKEAVDVWRSFEPWLGPLKAALGDLA